MRQSTATAQALKPGDGRAADLWRQLSRWTEEPA